MVQMEMRIDDEIDASRIAVDCFEPCADFLAGGKPDLVNAGHPLAEPADRIVLTIGMQAAVEKHSPFRVLDQEGRDRHGDAAFGTFHDSTKLTFEFTAGECV